MIYIIQKFHSKTSDFYKILLLILELFKLQNIYIAEYFFFRKSSKKKKDAEVTDNEENEEVLPEVSKDKFFEVSDSLKDAFKPSSKDLDEPKGFSLLSAFGTGTSKENDIENDENGE